MPIPEKYVRHIWKNLYLKLHALLLIDGRPLQILSTGKLNSNEGADFLDARIIIDGIEYCGAVEIHSCTSDWLKHHHHLNPRYASIILHAVFEHDQPLQNASPILELRRFLNDDVHKILAQCIKDDAMLHRPHTIACLPTVQHIDDTLKLEWIHALSEQRFQRKVERFASALTDEQYDELIYRGLMRALGYRENTSAFEALAQRVSFSELRFLTAYPFTERRRTLEAIYFSLSALLPSQPADKETAVYVHDLAKRFAETPFHTRPPLDRLAWIFSVCVRRIFPRFVLLDLLKLSPKIWSTDSYTMRLKSFACQFPISGKFFGLSISSLQMLLTTGSITTALENRVKNLFAPLLGKPAPLNWSSTRFCQCWRSTPSGTTILRSPHLFFRFMPIIRKG